jgi:hypothetical protein
MSENYGNYGEVEECSDDVYCESEDITSTEDNDDAKIVTTEMYDKFKESLKDEYSDLIRFVEYTIEKNRFDKVNFYKDYYSFSFQEKEEVVKEPQVVQSVTGSFTASNISNYRDTPLRNYDVEIYKSHVVIKIQYNSVLINGVEDIFEKYKEKFFDIYINQEKEKVKASLYDIYNISGLQLKKSREDKVNSILK